MDKETKRHTTGYWEEEWNVFEAVFIIAMILGMGIVIGIGKILGWF